MLHDALELPVAVAPLGVRLPYHLLVKLITVVRARVIVTVCEMCFAELPLLNAPRPPLARHHSAGPRRKARQGGGRNKPQRSRKIARSR